MVFIPEPQEAPSVEVTSLSRGRSTPRDWERLLLSCTLHKLGDVHRL